MLVEMGLVSRDFIPARSGAKTEPAFIPQGDLVGATKTVLNQPYPFTPLYIYDPESEITLDELVNYAKELLELPKDPPIFRLSFDDPNTASEDLKYYPFIFSNNPQKLDSFFREKRERSGIIRDEHALIVLCDRKPYQAKEQRFFPELTAVVDRTNHNNSSVSKDEIYRSILIACRNFNPAEYDILFKSGSKTPEILPNVKIINEKNSLLSSIIDTGKILVIKGPHDQIQRSLVPPFTNDQIISVWADDINDSEVSSLLKNGEVKIIVSRNSNILVDASKKHPEIIRIFFSQLHRYFEVDPTSKVNILDLADKAKAHGVLVNHEFVGREGQIATIFLDAIDRWASQTTLGTLLKSQGGKGVQELCTAYGLPPTSYDENQF